MANPKTTAGQSRGSVRGRARTGRAEQVDAVPGEDGRDPGVEQPLGGLSRRRARPTIAPAIDGGAIHATTRQSTRPSRACRHPPAAAAAALIAMFVPAAAAGFPAASRTAGSRSVPSTSPTTEPR